MQLTDQITDYINAAFTGLYIVSAEPDEAEREIVRHAHQHKWKLAVWDIAGGVRFPGNSGGKLDVGTGDPLAIVRALPTLASKDGTAVLVLHNYHRYLGNPEVAQTVFSQLIAGKLQRTFIVVLAPQVSIPVELEKLFVVIEHALPDREQLEAIARSVATEAGDVPDGEGLQRVLDAAAGLTRYEAEGSFALSIARHGSIRPDVITELKAQTLKKNNLLTLHRGRDSFAELGGLAALKDFCHRALSPQRSNPAVKPHGALLLSPPGCGKSKFARALGNETGRPTLVLDIGALYGSLVGATEQNVRQALRIADAMSPAIIFIDEIEKALGGVGSTGDSGVSTRLFGTLLTYLADRTSDTFVIGTCNNISKLPPEFARAERFDGVFFLDLPSSEEKNGIWDLYRRHYGIPDTQARPGDTDWTGAEIKSCCRLAALLDVPLTQAAHNVVPVAVTAAEQVEQLRIWASGRCLSASYPGVYQRHGPSTSATTKGGRRVSRPSSN